MSKKLLPAYLITFVNVLGFSILMPVLPFIVEDCGAPKWVYGLLLTFYSAFQFIGSPYLGGLSDDNGRKPLLIISQAGTLLSWIVFVIALSLPETPIFGFALPLFIIALSRILDGITGGNASVANAYVADITTPNEKSYIFGYLGGIAGLGMIIGPALGGAAASTSFGYSGTILLATLISFITLISLFIWLKESNPKENRQPKQKRNILHSFKFFTRIKEVNPSKFIKTLFIIKFFFSIMMAFYVSTIALFIIDLFNFDEAQLGYFMLFVGIFLAFNQVVMTKIFVKKFGPYNTLIIGLALSCLGLFSITLTDNLYLYLAFYYIMNLGLSLCFPTFTSLIAQHANPKKQGEIMGISESINSITLAVFPVIAAGLYGLIEYHVYYFVSLLPLTALIIAILRRKTINC